MRKVASRRLTRAIWSQKGCADKSPKKEIRKLFEDQVSSCKDNVATKICSNSCNSILQLPSMFVPFVVISNYSSSSHLPPFPLRFQHFKSSQNNPKKPTRKKTRSPQPHLWHPLQTTRPPHLQLPPLRHHTPLPQNSNAPRL